MAGAYCRYCGMRCFVLRSVPADAMNFGGRSIHMATCAQGAANDREVTGYDHTTATNPFEVAPKLEG